MKKLLFILLLATTVIFAKGTTIQGTYIGSNCGDLCYMGFQTSKGTIHLYGDIEEYKNVKKGHSYLVTYEKMSPMVADIGEIDVEGIVGIKPANSKPSKKNTLSVAKPSWCDNAQSYVEKHICKNPDLYKLEADLLQSYRTAREGKNKSQETTLKKSQRNWIKERAKVCKSKGDTCIAKYYKQRIATLNDMSASEGIVLKLKNITYNLDGKRISLLDGKYKSDKYSTVSFAELLAKGDLNGDGKEDYVVLLVSNGGGSGIFPDITVVMQTKNGLNALPNTIPMEDRVQINSTTISNEKIIMKVTEHGPNDPACCPSKKATRLYRVVKDNIVKLR